MHRARKSLFLDKSLSLLLFMTDVTDGGGTVFPFLGVRVQPVAGDLLLWRNNDAEGLCDTLSAHAYVGPTHVCNSPADTHLDVGYPPCKPLLLKMLHVCSSAPLGVSGGRKIVLQKWVYGAELPVSVHVGKGTSLDGHIFCDGTDCRAYRHLMTQQQRVRGTP